MPVTTRHPEYLAAESDWLSVRDCLRGQAQIKSKGELYLPKSGGQLMAEMQMIKAGISSTKSTPYSASKKMARFPELLEPMIADFAGLASRVPWRIENLPSAMDYLLNNAGSGVPLEGWQNKLIAEGLAMGRYAIMCDAESGAGSMPRLTWYEAESIINWRETQKIVTMLVAKESTLDVDIDEFSHDEVDRYRVWRKEDNRVTAELYDEDGNSLEQARTSFTDIPVVIGGTKENTSTVQRPPLIGVAESALSWYLLSAKHRWALAMTCDPLLVAFGFKPGEIGVVGSGVAISKDGDSRQMDIKYVEINGAGIQHMVAEMDRELQRAKEAGSRIKESGTPESGAALRQRTQSKTATLKSVDRNAARALEDSLNCMARSLSLPANITVTSSFDYTDDDIEAQVLTAISNAVELRQLPSKAVPAYVQSRGMLEDETLEEVMQMIEAEREESEAATVGLRGFGPADPDLDTEDEAA